MNNLYMPEQHEPLRQIPWSENVVKNEIERIYNTCLDSFEYENLWPLHPDTRESYKVCSSITGVWNGMAGTFWALKTLKDKNPHFKDYSFTTKYLPLLEQQQAHCLKDMLPEFGIDPESVGYLLGYSGTLLVWWRLLQDKKLLLKLERYIRVNLDDNNNEFMWSTSGTALVAWFLYQHTNDEKWVNLFQLSAKRILKTWHYNNDGNYLWHQDMYKVKNKFLGLVHGFAGNVAVLLQGFDLLDKQQQDILIKQGIETFVNTAKVNDSYANWTAAYTEPGQVHVWQDFNSKFFLQLCHGAPSMLISLAKLWPYMGEKVRDVFIKGANLIWDAGPLVKPWGLCHGTAGNGYAFLKLYKLTGDKIWYERALQFAMHAIHQYETMRDHYACIRTDAWCGDLGLALYLQDCIDQSDKFPMMDYF